MPDKRWSDGPRGIFCPRCGEEVHRRLVAKSYPAPGGQFRTRVCGKCLADVETLETAIGIETEVLDISGLSAAEVSTLRGIVHGMRVMNEAVR
jgi:hypothetical protein